jgi:hypothetical protein
MIQERSKATHSFAIVVIVRLTDSGVSSFQPCFQAKSLPWSPFSSSIAEPCSRLVMSTTKPFDFASPTEWDAFYRQQQAECVPSMEWHDSIALSDIAAVVVPNSRCLMVGCGTSRLPEALLAQPQSTLPRSLVFLDTSQTCLDQLKDTYGSVYGSTTMEYVCGDATLLTKYFSRPVNPMQPSMTSASIISSNDAQDHFDMIIDKGLTDALLCSEGWDGLLERMYHEASRILAADTGQYLLISYPLPRTTREFLVDVGQDVGLEWQFDIDLTMLRKKVRGGESMWESKERRRHGESRVSIALAVKSVD